MEQKIKSKRQRGRNFTKEEELLLLSEIDKFKNIIECKTTDKVHVSEKKAAWEKILCAFNAKNKCCRTLESMKIKYDNFKCRARKESAANNLYIRGTGGGPAGPDPVEDPVIENVSRIINKKTVVGNEKLLININIESLSAEQESLMVLDDTVEIMEVAEETQKATSTEAEKKKESWGTYTTKKLRKPMELIKEEIKKCKLEQEELIRKQKADIEEHDKKMKLLELEILLKQKMLNQN